jgi:hypothetical protein
LIKVIENALPQEEFDILVCQTTNWGSFPWFYAPNSAYKQTKDDLEQFSWAHTSILEGRDNSDYAEYHRELCDIIRTKYIEEETYGIRRVRFGMHTYFPHPVMNNPHIDFSVGSVVGLLYLNDSDGDTYFFDAIYDGPTKPTQEQLKDEWNKNKDMKVVESFTPKANTLILFEGRQYHCSSAPTKNQYRQIMNINWYTTDPLLDILNTLN